jgi:DNA replicative helicase MCM subunit Mcm2 (Cdc46/Mcm family)
MVGGSSKILAN